MSHHVQVIAADGEMRASQALAEASGVIHNSPAAIKLRHLQVMHCDVIFLAPSGAQGVTMSVCPSAVLWGPNLSKALNPYLSLIGLSQISVSSLT